MADPLIAPQTQRLAEDNNVEWRALSGSGEGGEVLERDVLAYLSRVMLGEEAADPTPEPLPEGLSAWPEEPTRQGRADDLFAASLATPAAKVEPTPAPSPWLPDTPEASPPPKSDEDGFVFSVDEDEPGAQEAAETPFTGWGAAPHEVSEGAETWVTPPVPEDASASLEDVATEPLEAGVPKAVHEQALSDIQALRTRIAALEEERLRHVSELHQLSRMQETIALQKDQGPKLSAAQSEVQRLKAELAAARGEAQRVTALEAKNRDLEQRLDRARTFRTNAKAEYERLLADNMMLEHEAADLKKRRSFKLWGK